MTVVEWLKPKRLPNGGYRIGNCLLSKAGSWRAPWRLEQPISWSQLHLGPVDGTVTHHKTKRDAIGYLQSRVFQWMKRNAGN